MLLDQLNVYGGVPDAINAVKLPLDPVPHDVLYNVKSKGTLCPTYTCVVWVHPVESDTVTVCCPPATLVNVTADKVVSKTLTLPSKVYV